MIGYEKIGQDVSEVEKILQILLIVRIIIQFNMFYDSQDFQMMHFMESSENKPVDFFKQILDHNSEQLIHEPRIEFSSHKIIQPQKNPDYCLEFEAVENICFTSKEQANKNSQEVEILDKNLEELEPSENLKQKQVSNEIKNKRRFMTQKLQRSKKSTRCYETIQEQQILQKNQEMVVDFSYTNGNEVSEQQCAATDIKANKFKKRIGKFILKEKSFGKTLKLSFPKKIVEMFINHYSKFPIQNEQIEEYNDRLRTKLKQSKKNDYTFEKQVSQILGQNKQEFGVDQNLQKEISKTNRCIFSEIISKTMKEEVIMRDKIAKNRQLYMIQLKVYALRCRSHRLSKKGTYK